MGMAGNMGGTQNPQSTQSSMQSPATGGKGGGMPMQTQPNYSTQASPMGGKGGGYSAPSKYTTQSVGRRTAQPTAATRPPSQEFIYTPTSTYNQGPVGGNIYDYNMSKLAQRLDPSANLPSTQRTYTPLPPPPPPPSYGGTAPNFFNGPTGGKGGAFNQPNPFMGEYLDVGGVSYDPSNTLRDTGEQEYDLPEPYQEFLSGVTRGNAPAPAPAPVPTPAPAPAPAPNPLRYSYTKGGVIHTGMTSNLKKQLKTK